MALQKYVTYLFVLSGKKVSKKLVSLKGIFQALLVDLSFPVENCV